MNDDVIYDGFGFKANGLVLTEIGHLKLAKRMNQIVQRANRNGAALPQSRFGEKMITLAGYFTGVSSMQAQQMYDMLATVFNRQDRPLLIPHAGSSRRYIATPDMVDITEPDGLNRLYFTVDFVVPEGIAINPALSTLFPVQTIVSASTTISTQVDGSALARPIITITLNSVTGTGIRTMSIRNARDYIGLSFERVWSGGDEIIIDSSRFQIYINGELKAPSGRMPTWTAGQGGLYYADTFSARNVSIAGSYNIGNL